MITAVVAIDREDRLRAERADQHEELADEAVRARNADAAEA